MCEVIHSALFTIFIYIDKLSEKVETDAWYFRSQGKLYKGCGVKVILETSLTPVFHTGFLMVDPLETVGSPSNLVTAESEPAAKHAEKHI